MSDEKKLTQVQTRILLIALVPLFMSLLSVSIVNVVLPAIAMDLGASETALQWVLTGYTLAFGVVLVAAGRAGDVLGRAPLFLFGVGFFGLGSLISGVAPDSLLLNIARVVMGFGSGLIGPQVVGLLQQYFRDAQRGRAFGLMGTTVGFSVAIGPVLGGILIAAFGAELGWRMAFLVNVPFAIASLVLAKRWLPGSAWSGVADKQADLPAPDPANPGSQDTSRPLSTPTSAGKKRIDLDPVGVVLLGVGVLLVLLPFVEDGLGLPVWAALPIGLFFVWLWVRWERRYRSRGRTPMVDIDLFRTKSFSSGTIIITLYFFGVSSVWVVTALYMQQGLGHTALAAGFIGLPAALLSAASADISGRFVFRLGRILVVYGIAICLLGLVLTAGVVWLLSMGIGSEWWMLFTLSFIGIAQGMVISPNQTLTLQEVPLRYSGSAGGVLQTGQRIGTAIGLALITALTFALVGTVNWHISMVGTMLTIAVVVLIAGGFAVREVRRTRPA